MDIRNDDLAFVEVLVGSSVRGANEQDYEALLVPSPFMSPSESRTGSNVNHVRIFEADKLVQTAPEKPWDRIRMVCSQPYSKDSPYGLSFIRLHRPPEKEETEVSSQKVTVTKGERFFPYGAFPGEERWKLIQCVPYAFKGEIEGYVGDHI
ncbi:DNA repair protein XRCC1 [Fukomys damarensis]|uniref:DNA repair protein XRCC1 n=1 Tax=Fukomys damarensis TaxID=885580 RepID=A0A091E0S2_FUKDA|nr:DNA repair protein XRCC1 [Fukomys damarensis]